MAASEELKALRGIKTELHELNKRLDYICQALYSSQSPRVYPIEVTYTGASLTDSQEKHVL